jgi:hypothetical protein
MTCHTERQAWRPATPPSPAASAGEGFVMVFLRDTLRDAGFGYKMRGTWQDGVLETTIWESGEYACDCARGRLLDPSGEYACGTERFVIERIVAWNTGEALYSETGA